MHFSQDLTVHDDSAIIFQYFTQVLSELDAPSWSYLVLNVFVITFFVQALETILPFLSTKRVINVPQGDLIKILVDVSPKVSEMTTETKSALGNIGKKMASLDFGVFVHFFSKSGLLRFFSIYSDWQNNINAQFFCLSLLFNSKRNIKLILYLLTWNLSGTTYFRTIYGR